ncbi:MAG: isoprenylcysteine carboxylmethyltransferase family protein [Acidobacteriaceae bacterium]
MQASNFEFRFRVWILAALYCLGFTAPWLATRARFGTSGSTAWIALSANLTRLNWLPLEQASLIVTWLAIVCAFAGAAVRVWGTAYLGSSIVQSGSMHAGQGGQVMAAGPYRHVRNPLYIGSVLFALSVAILMPPSGALVFIVLTVIFYFRLILGEEAFLANQLGAAYLDYRQRVPRLLPSVRPRIPAPPVRPQILQSLLSEILPIGYALCLAVLAWRYEPGILEQSVLVCFGLSLIAHALLPKAPAK